MSDPTPSMVEKGMAGISASGQDQPMAPCATFAARESSAQRPGQRFAEVVQKAIKRHQEPRHIPAGSAALDQSVAPDPDTTGAETRTNPDVEAANNIGSAPAQGMRTASTIQIEADRTGGGQSDQPHYTSSDVDYEKKYAPDAYGEELSRNARVWSVYNDEAQIADNEMVRSLNGTLDVLLVFAGLFSAVVTTFVAQSSQALSPDYAQITASLMYELVQSQRASTTGTPPNVPMSSLSFGSGTTQTTDLWVNGLWLTSLTFALLTALVSVLAKQWIQHYNSLSGGSPRNRAHLRQYRFENFERWKVRAIIGFLPVLLTVALLLFFAGLIVYVVPMDITISLVIIGFSAGILLAYSVMAALPIFVTHCAYKTPLTDYMITVGHPVIHYVLICPFQQAQVLCDFVYKSIRAKAMQRWNLRQLAEHCRLIWYRDSPRILKDREASIIVRRKSDVLTTDVLDWLISSPLNASAARIAVQASSDLKLDYDTQKIWAYSWRSHDYLQALDRDYTNFTLTSEHTAIAERLARVAMHHSPGYLLYVEQVWSLDLWERLYMQRDRIDSPAHSALLCLVLWIRFCDDERPLSSPSVMRRASDACSLLDISLTAPKLHPVTWRELDRLARTCLLLCEEPCPMAPEGRDESDYHQADILHEEIVATECHGQYRPPDDEFDPYESTAITLAEYYEGCEWAEGRHEFLYNLEKLKRILSEFMEKLESAEHANDAAGLEIGRLPEGAAEAPLGQGSAGYRAYHDAPGGVGNGEGIERGIGEVGVSERAMDDACDEGVGEREATDVLRRDSIGANARSSACARTPHTTEATAAVNAKAPDVEHDAGRGFINAAPKEVCLDAGTNVDERRVFGDLEPKQRDAMHDTETDSTWTANVAARAELQEDLESAGPRKAVADVHVVQESSSESVAIVERGIDNACGE
ncbi:uncharacterized protein SCHCODRAFT_02503552 [Schizophyllum commune H4-8]|nr:uncharacterized protein SCHCODRAFT_02503552 [Schizophyllum commune H4-8]KAI5892220.1 hypothetical protein SCHCODRAFT_02503552 [Schizophyllum commune H4-8]